MSYAMDWRASQMKVRKCTSDSRPKYPDWREFAGRTTLAGVAAIGIGAMAGGCNQPERTGGVPLIDSDTNKVVQSTQSVAPANSNSVPPEETRLRGDIAVEPASK